jgi:hypothetical protein
VTRHHHRATRRRHGLALTYPQALAGLGTDPVLFGDQAIESNSIIVPAGVAEATPFTARSSGQAAIISVYLGPATQANGLIVGLYSSRHGHPGSLLASGAEPLPTPGEWNAVGINSASVNTGSNYWIVILGAGSSLSLTGHGGGTCSSMASASTNLTSLPAPWSTGRRSTTCALSAYLSGQASGGQPGSGPQPPADTSLPVISGQAVQGQALSASAGTWSNSPSSYGYQWQDCSSTGCANIGGATTANYVPTSSDAGHAVDIVVTASNSAGSANATSAQTQTVLAPAPTAAFSFLPGAPVMGSAVTFDASASTCPDAPCSYAWDDDGGEPPVGSWGLGTGSTMQFAFQNTGTKYVRLTVQDAAGRTATVEHNVTVTANPPVNTGLPVVSGSAQVGQTLSASNGSWSGCGSDGSGCSYSYLWQDCDSTGGSCADIGGATASSYTLVGGDAGSTVRAKVTATNAGGSAQVASAQTAVVASQASSPPVNTGLPVVSGSAQVGQTLSASNGSWSGCGSDGSGCSYSYLWQDCDSSGGGCGNVDNGESGPSGAVYPTYSVVQCDFGGSYCNGGGDHTLRVTVTATNAYGSARAVSSATTPVTAYGGARYVYCSGDPTWSGGSSFGGNGWNGRSGASGGLTSGDWGAQYGTTSVLAPYAALADTQMVVFDDSANAMQDLGCHSVAASITPNDPGTCESSCAPPDVQRAQIISEDNIATLQGVGAPDYGMRNGQTWYYSVPFKTNSGWVGENSDPFYNDIFTFHPGGVGGQGNGAGGGTCCEFGVNVNAYGPWGHSQNTGQGSKEADCPAVAPFTTECMHMTFFTEGGYNCGTGFDSGTRDPHWITDPAYFVPGKRYVITVRVKWAYGGATPSGSMEIWVNGTEIGAFTNIATLDCGDVAYPNLENYRPSYQYAPSTINVNGGPYPSTNTVWYGGLVKGAGWNDVQVPLNPGAPVNTGLPTVSGTATHGNSLNATTGTWTNSPSSYSYQWQRCSTSAVTDNNSTNVGGSVQVCTDIPGATSANYTLQNADIGDVVQARVTATNASDSAVITTAPSPTVN